MTDELELKLGGIEIKAKGLLTIKLAFVFVLSILYFNFTLSSRPSYVLATATFLLLVVVYLITFFFSITSTFGRRHTKSPGKLPRDQA